MVDQTPAAPGRTAQRFLILLIAVCTLLIVINVVTALHLNSAAARHSNLDIYTLETDQP
ncbi:MAG TPA: hypothetical protein PKX07_21880 [Aggregatilineales bacterium]|jgi:hypothetical protein|nr:hypothetical protein [Aggregatilineales bacterium]